MSCLLDPFRHHRQETKQRGAETCCWDIFNWGGVFHGWLGQSNHGSVSSKRSRLTSELLICGLNLRGLFACTVSIRQDMMNNVSCPVGWTLACFASLHFSCRESNDFDRPVVDGLPFRCFFRQSFLDRELFEGPVARFLAETFGIAAVSLSKSEFPVRQLWDCLGFLSRYNHFTHIFNAPVPTLCCRWACLITWCPVSSLSRRLEAVQCPFLMRVQTLTTTEHRLCRWVVSWDWIPVTWPESALQFWFHPLGQINEMSIPRRGTSNSFPRGSFCQAWLLRPAFMKLRAFVEGWSMLSFGRIIEQSIAWLILTALIFWRVISHGDGTVLSWNSPCQIIREQYDGVFGWRGGGHNTDSKNLTSSETILCLICNCCDL